MTASAPLPLTPDHLSRALAGDREALREFVASATPIIQVRAARLLARGGGRAGRDVRQEVEDLTQDVFARLFADRAKALRQWQPDKGLSLPNFVGLVAEREVMTTMRSKRRNPWSEQPICGEDVARALDTGSDAQRRLDSRAVFRALLARLRERQSPLGMRMFQLLYVEQRSLEHVCEATGMGRAAVYKWRSRLRKAVKELADEVGYPPDGALSGGAA